MRNATSNHTNLATTDSSLGVSGLDDGLSRRKVIIGITVSVDTMHAPTTDAFHDNFDENDGFNCDAWAPWKAWMGGWATRKLEASDGSSGSSCCSIQPPDPPDSPPRNGQRPKRRRFP